MQFIRKRLVKFASLYLIFPACIKALRIARSGSGKKKIIAALAQHLGDNIAAEPLDSYLKKQNPNHYFIRIVGRSFQNVVSNNPNIDLIIPVSCLSEWVYLKLFLKPFYKLYDYHVHRSFCLKYRLRISNPNSYGIDDSNYYNHGNLLQVFCKCCGVNVINEKPLFRLGPMILLEGLPEKYAVIHVVSNSEQREWDLQKWCGLIDYFTANNFTVIEVGLKSNLQCTNPKYKDYSGKLSLREIAYVISKSSYFVGIDSAFAHFANAFNVPRLILLGHFNQFTYYLPYSGLSPQEEADTVVHHNAPVKYLPLQTVIDKIKIS